MSRENLIVLGAGVIGLQTAVTLLEAGFAVSVVAEHWPDTSIEVGEYTSPWAGAQWRPHALQGTKEASWDLETYAYWKKLAAREKEGDVEPYGPSGVYEHNMKIYYSEPDVPTPWWSAATDTFKRLPESSLPSVAKTGFQLNSFVLPTTRYLPYLQDKARSMGAKFHTAKLPLSDLKTVVAAAKEATRIPKPFAIVNALGFGGAKLVDDTKVSPSRGQTLLVKGEANEMRTWVTPDAGKLLAVFPYHGTGTSIVGATRGPGRSDLEEDKDDTEWLTKYGAELAPELVQNKGAQNHGLEVLKPRVGLRPIREDGVRLETEEVGEDVVVHEYGHGGAGYQNSIGSAKAVLRLIEAIRK